MSAALRCGRLVLHVLHCVFLLLWTFPRVSPAQRETLLSNWARSALHILNVHVIWRGYVPPRSTASTVFVCNHVSWVDTLALLAIRPVRFVAKAEVRSWPLIGWMAVHVGTIFLKRTPSRALDIVTRAMRLELSRGDCLVLFPEGTMTNGAAVAPFYSSLFEAAVQSGSWVWPVGLRYHGSDGVLSNRVAMLDAMDFLPSLWRILRGPRLHLTVSFGVPLAAKGWDRKRLARVAHRAVLALCTGGHDAPPALLTPTAWRRFRSPGLPCRQHNRSSRSVP